MTNLEREGIREGVHFTGDVMYDVFLKMKPSFDDSYHKELGLETGKFMVMTMHRDFNVDDAEILSGILKGVAKVAHDMPVVFTIHPRTSGRIKEFKLENLLEGIKVIPPIDYLKLMGLTQNAYAAITDSGGYQKETYFSGKKALVLMPDTSWIELVNEGINVLVDGKNIYDAFKELKTGEFKENIYGSGDAAQRIVKIISDDIV